MKLLLLCLVALTSVSCSSWPKDSYIENAKTTVNTPWGPSTSEAGVIATGKAAQNASIQEIIKTRAPQPKLK